MPDFPPRSPLKLAVLISGGGTTLKNLIAQIGAARLDAVIELVVSSDPAAGGLGFARAAGIPTAVIEQRSFASVADYSQAVFHACRGAMPDQLVLAGVL